MSNFHRMTRRGLLGAGAAALATPVFAGARKLGPNDRVNLAVIGAGGQGSSNMAKLTGENIVAACDVDFDRVARGMLDSHFEMNPMRMALKAAYEETFGRIATWVRGSDRALLDDISARQAASQAY